MPEELGVEGGREDGRSGVAGLGSGFAEGFGDEADEVLRVALSAGGGFVGEVRLLVAHVDTRASDAPVAVSSGPTLFVEVDIVSVAGVPGVAGPHLDAGAGVAREDGDGAALGSGSRGGRAGESVGVSVGALDKPGVVEGAWFAGGV